MTSGKKKQFEPSAAGIQKSGIPWWRRLKLFLKITISAASLSYIVYIIDGDKFLHAFREIRIDYFIVSLGILMVNSFILAFKFKILLAPAGIRQSLISLFKINFVSRFYALLLTTAVGQGVVRWYRTTKHQENKLNFLPVLIIERASFLFALCLFIIVSSGFLANTASRELAYRLLPFAVAGLLGLPGICLAFFFLFKPLADENTPGSNDKSIRGLISGVYKSFSLFKNQSGVVLLTTCIAFIWHLAYLLRVFFLFAAVSVNTDLFHLCWMASLVLLIQILPVTVNGIGLREGVYAYLFSLAGMPLEKGVLIGSLFFVQMLIASAIGGMLVLFSQE